MRESREGVEYTHFNFRQSFEDKVSLGFHTPLSQTFFQKLHRTAKHITCILHPCRFRETENMIGNLEYVSWNTEYTIHAIMTGNIAC